MSCNLIEFVWIFDNDSEAIISRISAHCPKGQTFLSEKHSKEFANHIHLVKMIEDMKLTLAKNMLPKVSAYIARKFFLFAAPWKAAFDCYW